MSEDNEEKEVYVLLEFPGKDSSKYFKQQSVYFRMLNLNDNKPIVEIGDDIYEGIYDDAVGTNVYFQEVEDSPPNSDIFEGTTPITLQYLLKQTKILKMKKIGTKPKPVLDAAPLESVNIHIQDDYRNLLEKYENNTLNIEDCITEDRVEDSNSERQSSSESTDDTDEYEEQVEVNFKWEATRLPPAHNLKPEWFTAMTKSTSAEGQQPPQAQANPIYSKYAKLQKLAEQPVKHKINPEVVENNKTEQLLNTLPKTDFYVWKNLVMQCVEQQTVNLDVNRDHLEDFVDVEKSVQAGIIAPSNSCPRIFTKEEKQELFSFKNFINVSPLMKFVMLQDFICIEQIALDQITEEELNEVGSDGCTPRERLQLLKNFKEDLKAHIISRAQDAEPADDISRRFGDLSLVLSDDEEVSDTDSSSSENYDDDDEDNDEHEEDEAMSEVSEVLIEEGTSSSESDGEVASASVKDDKDVV